MIQTEEPKPKIEVDVSLESGVARDRMLAPTAYSEALLPSLRLARSSRTARRIGKTLLVLLLLSFLLAAFAPWQQSVTGAGDVMAYSPGQRPQTLQAPIKGRIVRWRKDLVENMHVKKDDFIVEIQDMDPELMRRLESQVVASKSAVTAAQQYLLASERNRDAADKFISSTENLLRTYKAVKDEIVGGADAAIEGAQNKVEAERQNLGEMEAAFTQVEADYHRQKSLFDDQIVSELKFQMAERKYKEAKAKVEKARFYVETARNVLTEKKRDRDAKEQKAQADIDYANASLDKARGEFAKAESAVHKATSDHNKAQKELLEMETKMARQESQVLVAPFDGFLTEISADQGSGILKGGEALCTIVPDTADRAVQVWLDGNDAPLVGPGRHVRLQFEGWPAVQFAGWPSVAVGTFGGTVVSVDATDDGKGKFRALVRPDKGQPDWPDERYLRQGVRAHAWVLLEQVPLWYELWRNMNGFPPVVEQSKDKAGGKDKAKKPKLPK